MNAQDQYIKQLADELSTVRNNNATLKVKLLELAEACIFTNVRGDRTCRLCSTVLFYMARSQFKGFTKDHKGYCLLFQLDVEYLHLVAPAKKE